jgi:glycosyltransferase involved in cell wall biosynthesis
MKRVTFGFVNCNRLHYLRSQFESLLETTKNYDNREFIIVDNASVEPETQEYLNQKEAEGVKVIRYTERDPNNEFARGMNKIVSLASGDYITILQCDAQFVMRDWLQSYVNFYESHKDEVGCVILSAPRRVTIDNGVFVPTRDNQFLFDFSRPPVSGAGEVMYHRDVLSKVGSWKEHGNLAFEGTQDSETDMLQRAAHLISRERLLWKCAVPVWSPEITIYTDARGTMARIRGDKRYGDYWAPKVDFRYYEISDYKDQVRLRPVSIEELAKPIGWSAPLDANGNWKKNPIRPETALPSDFVDLIQPSQVSKTDDCQGYISEWLNT